MHQVTPGTTAPTLAVVAIWGGCSQMQISKTLIFGSALSLLEQSPVDQGLFESDSPLCLAPVD